MNKMTKVVLSALMLGVMAPTGSLYANMGHHKMGSEKHLKKMTKKLDLTAEQQDKVKKLMDEKMQKMEEIRKNFHDQLRAVLTEEQQKKWDAKMEKHRKRHQQ